MIFVWPLIVLSLIMLTAQFVTGALDIEDIDDDTNIHTS